jgi:hypothetical protein
MPKIDLEHQNDKGKPAATQGRKARGPLGVAQLPKLGETK